MQQSSIIFGGLFVGFLIYVTIRGRLAQYVGLFYSTSATPAQPTPFQINPTGTGINPVTSLTGGSQVPYEGFTPSGANPFSGLIPGA